MANISLILPIVDDKILMFQRANTKWDKFSGKFGFPGGHVKDKESTKDAAVREAMEETGLKIQNPIYVKTYKFDGNIIYLYAEKIPNTEGIKLNHEHTGYKLFDPQDIETNKSVIPTCKYMYEDYLEKQGNSVKEKEVENQIYENTRIFNKIIITESQFKKILETQQKLKPIHEVGGFRMDGITYDVIKTNHGIIYAGEDGILLHNDKLVSWDVIEKLLLKYTKENSLNKISTK